MILELNKSIFPKTNLWVEVGEGGYDDVSPSRFIIVTVDLNYDVISKPIDILTYE